MTAARSFSTSPTGYDVTGVISKNRRQIAANSMWNVYLDHIVDARGNEVPDYLVITGKHSRESRLNGVVVLPILRDGFVLLRSYRHALAETIWEVPRGLIDEGETAVIAALRELKEETGLICASERLVPLGHYAPEPGTMGVRAAVFAATQCEGVPAAPSDELGLDDLRVVDRNAMDAMVASGEVDDAGTLIAYHRFSAWQSQHREEKNVER